MRTPTNEKTSHDNDDKRKTRYVRPPQVPSPLKLSPLLSSQPADDSSSEICVSSVAPATHQVAAMPMQLLRQSTETNLSTFAAAAASSATTVDARTMAATPVTTATTITPITSLISHNTNQNELASSIDAATIINRPDIIKQDNIDIRDSIDEYNEELGDIIYRLRQFKDFSTRSNRGSSKNVCSLISVNVQR